MSSYIVSQQNLDTQGRINISTLYPDGRPTQIVIAVEAEKKRILFLNPEQIQGWGIKQTVDNKGRIVLPKWLREDIGEKSLLLIVEENDEVTRYAKLKTASLL